MFELSFTQKTAVTRAKMAVLEKEFKLVLKTIYKKVFLKYQANARFPSLFLPSRTAIFGGGRKPRKKKEVCNPIRGSHQGMGCPNYRQHLHVKATITKTFTLR